MSPRQLNPESSTQDRIEVIGAHFERGGRPWIPVPGGFTAHVFRAVAESSPWRSTLHQRHRGQVPPADQPSHRAASGLRAPWFDVSCCPTNLTRTLASLGAYISSTDATGLQIHQYVPSTISATTQAGQQIEVVMETEYPFTGGVTCRVVQAPEGPWTLSLRIPQWAEDDADPAWIPLIPYYGWGNRGPSTMRVWLPVD